MRCHQPTTDSGVEPNRAEEMVAKMIPQIPIIQPLPQVTSRAASLVFQQFRTAEFYTVLRIIEIRCI